MMLEFKTPIPVIVEKDKEGYDIYVTNGGTFENDIWVVILNITVRPNQNK